MIQVFQIFSNLKDLLQSKKREGSIDKYYLSIDQINEITVIVISLNKIEKKDFFNDNRYDGFVNYLHLTNEELQEDYFYTDIFEKNGNEIVDYKNSRRKLTNLLNPTDTFIPEIPVVTFYSYKGGMGRSTNLVVTSTYLARHHKKKIVIIDCDFEAPGFSNFFLEEPAEPMYQNGIMEYFFDSESLSDLNLDDYSREVSKEYSLDGEIRIVPAGNLDSKIEINNSEFPTHLSQYLEGLARLDLSSTETTTNKFKQLLSDIKKQYNPDAIFIDSRTGFTDIFGITALKLSSQIIGFFSSSAQNNPGIYQFISSITQLINSKSKINAPIIVNSFSDPNFFSEFKRKVDEVIISSDVNDDSFSLSPYYYYFRHNSTLAEIGTTRENKKDWLEQIDDNSFSKGYTDVAEKLNEFLLIDPINKSNPNQIIEITDTSADTIGSKPLDIQNNILNKLSENWPDLYADSEGVDYQKEFDEKRIFYRDSMKDIFNFTKFIVLGNKGTGKSYLFQALKNKDIKDELKKQAQKTNFNIDFLHLVDKKNNYFIATKGLESFKDDINNIGDFYTKFWKVYTWRSIIDKINPVLTFKSSIEKSFEIKNNDTTNLKDLIFFIKDINNIIKVESELEQLDKELNSKQIDIIAIYDNLDLMVEPANWKDEMSSLINFWQFANFKRIYGKLFLRSDLFKTIRGINNVQSLSNNTIFIEWQKEEIFNYFYNLVKRYSKDDFISAVENYNFKKISDDAVGWVNEFKKKFSLEKQHQFEEAILRKLCWVFFGQYPDIKAHGESYDWLYKNIMNADETISVRPFLDLLKLSIDEYKKDFNKDITAILPGKYYTAKNVRSEAVKSHFADLVTEKGNEYLEQIFEFIDKNEDYQYYQMTRHEFYDLLNKVISKHSLDKTVEDLETLLIINGIIKQTGNFKYSFAFLYKYRLGLKNRNKRKSNFRNYT